MSLNFRGDNNFIINEYDSIYSEASVGVLYPSIPGLKTGSMCQQSHMIGKIWETLKYFWPVNVTMRVSST